MFSRLNRLHRSNRGYALAALSCAAGLAGGVVLASSQPTKPSESKGKEGGGQTPAEGEGEQKSSTNKWYFYKGKPSPSSVKDVKIFSGSGHPQLAADIAGFLGKELSKSNVGRFNDGEVAIQILEDVRNGDIYIIQPTCSPVNENILELLLYIAAMKRASARKITAVIPYYAYARQDQKPAGRMPISAADVARMIETMGVDRVIAIDLHSGQIQGFFGPKIPVDNIAAGPVAAAFYCEKSLKDPVVVSPDAAGVYRAKEFRASMIKHGYDAGLAMVIRQKSRLSGSQELENEARAGEGPRFLSDRDLRGNKYGEDNIVGSVRGCDVIIVDDIIDTGGTLVNAAAALKAGGARKIYAFATHGVLSGDSIERLEKSDIDEICITDTIPRDPSTLGTKFRVLTLAPIVAEVIHRIHNKSSVSSLWKQEEEK